MFEFNHIIIFPGEPHPSPIIAFIITNVVWSRITELGFPLKVLFHYVPSRIIFLSYLLRRNDRPIPWLIEPHFRLWVPINHVKIAFLFASILRRNLKLLLLLLSGIIILVCYNILQVFLTFLRSIIEIWLLLTLNELRVMIILLE